jgi:hypothetical protein
MRTLKAFRSVPIALVLAGLLPGPGAEARGAVVALASRDVELAGGGTLRIATRFEDNEYLVGAGLSIEPLLGASAPFGKPAPEPLGLIVTLERRGFAPCLAPDETVTELGLRPDGAGIPDCAAGTPPEVPPETPTGPFVFRFDQLFKLCSDRLAPVEGGSAHGAFGTARFRVNMRVRASDGSVEDVRFPVTVTVRDGAPGAVDLSRN